MAATQLSIYSGALRLLGERKLSSLVEDRPARHYLDDAWADGLVNECLEEGFWKFATRSLSLTASPSTVTSFGYSYIFQKPDDYVRTKAICTDPYFLNTLNLYSDDGGYWSADIDTIYVQIISNSIFFGLDYSLWPETFNNFVQAMLADKVKELITGNDGKYDRIKKALKDAKINARSKDAMAGPIKFSEPGTFIKARMQGRITNNYR
jgi:hypothetical protein